MPPVEGGYYLAGNRRAEAAHRALDVFSLDEVCLEAKVMEGSLD
jgi:hypothetical protein